MKTTKTTERRRETTQPQQPSTRTTTRAVTRGKNSISSSSSSRRGSSGASGSNSKNGRPTGSRRTRSTSSHRQLVDRKLSAATRRTGSEPRQAKCSAATDESKRSGRKSVRRNLTSELSDARESVKKTKRDNIVKQAEKVFETLPSETTAAEKKTESEDAEMQQTVVKSEFSVQLRPKRRRRYNFELLSRFVRPSPRSSTINTALKHDTQQRCDDEQQQQATAAAAAAEPPTDVILLVSCGDNAGRMALNKLDIGSRGSCIEINGSWLTPNEFQLTSGRTNTKDWKRSIRHHGKSLKFLVDEGLLSLYSPPVCICEYCDLQSTTKDAETSGDIAASSPCDPGTVRNADVTSADEPEVDKKASQRVAKNKHSRLSEPTQHRLSASRSDETTNIKAIKRHSAADTKTTSGNGKGFDAESEIKTKRGKKERANVEKKKSSEEEKEKRTESQKHKEIETTQRRKKELSAVGGSVDGKGKDASEDVEDTAASVQQRSLTILNVPQFLQTTNNELNTYIDQQLDTTHHIRADTCPVADLTASQRTGDKMDAKATLDTPQSANNNANNPGSRDVIMPSLTPTSRDTKAAIGSSNISTGKSKTALPATPVAGLSALPGVSASPALTKPAGCSSSSNNQSSSPRSNYGLYPPALYQVYPPYIVMGIPVQPFAYTQQQTPSSGDKYMTSPDKPKVTARSTVVGRKVRDQPEATNKTTKRRPRRKQDGDVSSTTPDCSLHATVSGLMTSSASITETKPDESVDAKVAGVQPDLLPSVSRESGQISSFVYDIYGALDLTCKK